MYNTYHLIYPRGDKKILRVLELSSALDYELSDYSVASSESFMDEDVANDYGQKLAARHGLAFEYKDGRAPYLEDTFRP
jgi:hypothetical protein